MDIVRQSINRAVGQLFHHFADARPRAPKVFALGREWTALRWQGFYLSALQLLVGAAMYPTCRCGSSYATGHNAIRAAQVPIESSHSKVHGPIGFS